MTGYDVVIRRNSDGVVRTYHHPTPWGEYCDYQWFEGNYSCDCNRHLFFQEAANEDDGEDAQCGETRYAVIKFVMPDGSEMHGDGGQ
jgi:hypothetical protein